jgi:spore coat polysaccharide biosynthesis protein SpsF
MRIVAIIQARMGSTRLPGKVLMDIGGQTMLARVVNRVRRATLIDETIVATTVNLKDEPIVAECERLNLAYFRGSEENVLERYYEAALKYKAEGVVRITSDCPLIDPGEIDKAVSEFLSQESDYASNSLKRTYPRGLDTEVMTIETLAKAWQEANDHYERAHVTPYIYQNPKLFKLRSVKAVKNYSNHRWTVDTSEDLVFIRAIYQRLNNEATFGWKDVLEVLNREPQLMELNKHIVQKATEEG